MLNDKLINNSHIIDLIYPIGSIYMSVNNTSPATLFGGTWQQLKDRFLIGTGDTYSNGASGGASTLKYTPQGTVGGHTLTINEIPKHSHSVSTIDYAETGSKFWVGSGNYTTLYFKYPTTSETGGGQSHNHGFTGTQATLDKMPPYLAVYMWKRTA